MCRAPVPTRSRARKDRSPVALTAVTHHPRLRGPATSTLPVPVPFHHLHTLPHFPPHLSFRPPTHGREPDLIHSQGTGRQPTIRPNGRDKPAAIGQSFTRKPVVVCAGRSKSPCGCLDYEVTGELGK